MDTHTHIRTFSCVCTSIFRFPKKIIKCFLPSSKIRLSDYLFVAARYAAHKCSQVEEIYVSRPKSAQDVANDSS